LAKRDTLVLQSGGGGVEMRFFPLENSVVYLPWQQEARRPDGPKSGRSTVKEGEEEEDGKILFIY
jgi:hypothetical protein